MSDIERVIAERAEDDGQYAIAYALLKVANQLKWLGTGDAAGPMGAIEFLAVRVGEKLQEGLSEVAEAVRDASPSAPMDDTFVALGEIADATKNRPTL